MTIHDYGDHSRHTYGGFELDSAALKLKSVKDNKIVLPYKGILPDGLGKAESAAVSFNVMVWQRPNVLLIVVEGGKETRYPLDCTTAEIKDILTAFYAKHRNPIDSGLSTYWYGYFQSSFQSWSNLTTMPANILAIVDQLSEDEKTSILSRLSRRFDGAQAVGC